VIPNAAKSTTIPIAIHGVSFFLALSNAGGAIDAEATMGTASPGGAIAAAAGGAKGSDTTAVSGAALPSWWASSSLSAVARRDVMGTTLLRAADVDAPDRGIWRGAGVRAAGGAARMGMAARA
jgi:hypothetical protein